jgi:hypothetical protein
MADTQKKTNTQKTSSAQKNARGAQAKINEGQRRINFELNEVDKQLIAILREIVEALKADPTAARVKRDMNRLEKLLDAAQKTSGEVAEIDPPGCQGPYPN